MANHDKCPECSAPFLVDGAVAWRKACYACDWEQGPDHSLRVVVGVIVIVAFVVGFLIGFFLF